jgi:hypothetical protein
MDTVGKFPQAADRTGSVLDGGSGYSDPGRAVGGPARGRSWRPDLDHSLPRMAGELRTRPGWRYMAHWGPNIFDSLIAKTLLMSHVVFASINLIYI